MTTSTERDRHRGGLGRAVLTLFAQCRWQEPGQGRARQTPSWDGPCPAQFTRYLLKNKGWAGKRGQKKDQKVSGACGLGAPSDHGDAGPRRTSLVVPGFGNGHHPGAGTQAGLGVRVSRLAGAPWLQRGQQPRAGKIFHQETVSGGHTKGYLLLVSRHFAGAGPLGLSAPLGLHSAPASTFGLFWGTAVPNATDVCPSSLALGISVRQLLNVPSEQILIIHNVRRVGRMRSTGLRAPQPCSTLCN